MTMHTVDAATKAGLAATETATREDVEAILAAARPHIVAEVTADLRDRLVKAQERLIEMSAGPLLYPSEGSHLASKAEGVKLALFELDDTTRSR